MILYILLKSSSFFEGVGIVAVAIVVIFIIWAIVDSTDNKRKDIASRNNSSIINNSIFTEAIATAKSQECFKEGDFVKAKEWIELAIKSNPQNRQYHSVLKQLDNIIHNQTVAKLIQDNLNNKEYAKALLKIEYLLNRDDTNREFLLELKSEIEVLYDQDQKYTDLPF